MTTPPPSPSPAAADISVDYVDSMGTCETVVNAARVSFGDRITAMRERDSRLLVYLATHDHLSPFEHCAMNVRITCPLYVRSQIMRHRTFSYNEISRRYTDKDVVCHVPRAIRTQSESNRQASGPDMQGDGAGAARSLIAAANDRALESYRRLLDMGVARETARGVLPCNTMTEFYMTGNLRNWVHFVRLRDHSDAQLEVQEIGRRVRELLVERFGEAARCLLGASS